MKIYIVKIRVYERQIKDIYLLQDKNLTEEDLPSIKEMVESEFDFLAESGIQLVGNIEEVNND